MTLPVMVGLFDGSRALIFAPAALIVVIVAALSHATHFGRLRKTLQELLRRTDIKGEAFGLLWSPTFGSSLAPTLLTVSDTGVGMTAEVRATESGPEKRRELCDQVPPAVIPALHDEIEGRSRPGELLG